jgi:hypothetical protein
MSLELKIVDGAAVARARAHDRGHLTPDERDDERAADDAAYYFTQSYHGMRFAIGLVAFALPWLLIVIDRWLITGEPQIRGSMSAYYHSSARDVFVGGLIATGGFMISYMTGKMRTYDYVFSSLAGLLVIVVALVPTGRSLSDPGFAVSRHSCDDFPGPPACNGIEQHFGENVAQVVHRTCASAFVVLLVALCVVFALREFGYGPAAEQLCGRDRNVRAVWRRVRNSPIGLWHYLTRGMPDTARTDRADAPRHRTLLYLAMALLIVAAIAWSLVGVDVTVPGTHYTLATTYVTEFVAFNAFGVAWMASSKDLEIFRRARVTLQRVAGAVVPHGRPAG